jgi:hypothetical protein
MDGLFLLSCLFLKLKVAWHLHLFTYTASFEFALKSLIPTLNSYSYTARLRELDRLISEEQPLTQKMVWPSAFISFK